MDGIKYVVVTEKIIQLLVKNQYTSNVESGSTRIEIKHWIELFLVSSMAIHLYKTSTPGARNGAIDSQHHCGKGRNTRGIITARHRGGGHKCLYRKIDFQPNEKDIYGRIITIEYDPNQNVYFCLIHYGDDTFVSSTEVPIKMGNALPLSARYSNMEKIKLFQAPIEPEAPLVSKRGGRVIHISFDDIIIYIQKAVCFGRSLYSLGRESTSTDMPLGMAIHNIEITLGRGGQLATAAGVVAKLIAKEGKSTTLKLPYGKVRLISKNCSTIVGQKSLGRAGSKCWLGKRPVVRRVVMNPVDHPHGGGEGRAPIGRKKPTTPWGYPALGRRSRKRNKYSDNLILRRRSK
ncbi:hypothetical protein CXB51_019176 [Gossypium anomalum]|uniref:50S ribosomal protein L2, chloroplastic n=1 Tax=Gossypium anomalum TaxID=47600 RepID=A0A8J5YSV4_9ROSI|nr:hypothetical protein CXB51_019176 [Gossypium anomalum]